MNSTVKPAMVGLSKDELLEKALMANEGVLNDNGALIVETGHRTGRSPKDRFIVKDALTENTVDWGNINQPFCAQQVDALWQEVEAFARQNYTCYEQSLRVGASDQFGINVKTVIINNGWQGMVRQWQQSFFGERYSSSNMEIGAPDFVMLAQAYGIKGMLVRDRAELSAAIAEMLAHDGPVLMDVRVTKNENCYPMIAPGKSNAHMLGLPQKERPSAEFVNCKNCGTTNPTANKFCPECGNQL